MNTVAVPLTAFSGIQKNNIEAVYLAFPAGSKGTLLIDSLECSVNSGTGPPSGVLIAKSLK